MFVRSFASVNMVLESSGFSSSLRPREKCLPSWWSTPRGRWPKLTEACSRKPWVVVNKQSTIITSSLSVWAPSFAHYFIYSSSSSNSPLVDSIVKMHQLQHQHLRVKSARHGAYEDVFAFRQENDFFRLSASFRRWWESMAICMCAFRPIGKLICIHLPAKKIVGEEKRTHWHLRSCRELAKLINSTDFEEAKSLQTS